MNGIDIGIVIVVFLSAVIGLIRGVTREVLSLVSWTGAGVSTVVLFPLAQTLARAQIQNPLLADGTAGLVTFILFLIIFSLLSHFFSGLVRRSALGGIDRSLGFGFGVVRGIFVLCVIEIMMSCFVARDTYPETIKNGRFSTSLMRASDSLQHVFPCDLRQFISDQRVKNGAQSVPTKVDAALMNDVLAAVVEQQAKKSQAPPPINDSAKQQAIAQTEADKLAELKPAASTPTDTNTSYAKSQKQQMERLLRQDER